MFRVKDPKVSLDFYTRVMGMRYSQNSLDWCDSYEFCSLLSKFDFPDMSFTLYFLGYEPLEKIPDDPTERVNMSCFWTCHDVRSVDGVDVSSESMLGADAQLGHRVR